ncbi:MAG: Ig-like domain-containing protein [Patescibacteria group bacterium]|nr:Ig-like domain-containing protein [Patescibacteria group bacterium]
MLSRKKITVLFILFLAVIFLFPQLSLAQAAQELGIDELADAGVNLGTRDIRQTIALIINIFLGFLGVLTTLIILYGGFIWMTSGGSSDKVDKAKRIIINGVIGLVIVLSSYAIARFILQNYDRYVIQGPGGSGVGSGYSGGVGLSGGVLDSHYPARNATGIPRNTNIYVTFREDMDVSTIVANASCVSDCPAHETNIRLYIDGTNNYISGSDLLISYTASPRVFEFNPYGNTDSHLGSDTENVRYRMDLASLRTAAGAAAFPLVGGYSWRFTVSTDLDLAPPRVISVQPRHNSSNNPRNSIVQINFSEAVNPLFAVGIHPSFANITVSTAGSPVAGEYVISNQYQTIEFMTDDLCGNNSCGGEVYCLPGGADFIGEVTNNIRDMAGNQLNCAGSCGVAAVAPTSYGWQFATNNQIDLTPPVISSMDEPNSVGANEPIRVVFDKTLLSSSINTNSVNLTRSGGGLINYWMRIDSGSPGDTLRIQHDTFDLSADYRVTLNSGIKDARQNCWYPCACEDPVGGSCVCDNNASGSQCPGVNCQVP